MKINCKPSGVTVEWCIKVYKIKQWPFRRGPAQTSPQLLLRHVDLISHSLTPSCLPKSHRRCLTLANSEKPQMSGKFCMYKFSDYREVSGERKGPVLFLFSSLNLSRIQVWKKCSVLRDSGKILSRKYFEKPFEPRTGQGPHRLSHPEATCFLRS